jgi:hypothetical protein
MFKGASGSLATNIEIGSDYKLMPTELRAVTLKAYSIPFVKLIVVV